jgi:hypothetical protein
VHFFAERLALGKEIFAECHSLPSVALPIKDTRQKHLALGMESVSGSDYITS